MGIVAILLLILFIVLLKQKWFRKIGFWFIIIGFLVAFVLNLMLYFNI